MRLNRITYLFKEGFKSIFTHGFMSFASVTIIVACLLIMGTFSLLAVNVDYIIEQYEQENQILAFVDEDLTLEEAEEIRPRIAALPNVRDVEFVTREQAMESFVSKHQDDDSTFDGVGADWFRHRYVVYLDDISMMSETADAIRDVSGVAKVNAHLEISTGFVLVRNIVSILSIVLIVILFIVSLFIMSNTIKLATFNRKEEIAIMKMVGAGNAFIRCPFVIEGLALGAAGGLVAFGLQWLLYSTLRDRIMTTFLGTLADLYPFTALMWPLLLVFLAVGLVVGAFGSNIAIRNYLKV